MQIRTPAVAGMFYQNEKKKLEKQIDDCFSHLLMNLILSIYLSKKGIET